MADVLIPMGLPAKSAGYTIKTLLWDDIQLTAENRVAIPDGKALSDVLLYILNYDQTGTVSTEMPGNWYKRGWATSDSSFRVITGCGSNASSSTHSGDMTIEYFPSSNVEAGQCAVLTVVYKK